MAQSDAYYGIQAGAAFMDGMMKAYNRSTALQSNIMQFEQRAQQQAFSNQMALNSFEMQQESFEFQKENALWRKDFAEKGRAQRVSERAYDRGVAEAARRTGDERYAETLRWREQARGDSLTENERNWMHKGHVERNRLALADLKLKTEMAGSIGPLVMQAQTAYGSLVAALQGDNTKAQAEAAANYKIAQSNLDSMQAQFKTASEGMDDMIDGHESAYNNMFPDASRPQSTGSAPILGLHAGGIKDIGQTLIDVGKTAVGATVKALAPSSSVAVSGSAVPEAPVDENAAVPYSPGRNPARQSLDAAVITLPGGNKAAFNPGQQWASLDLPGLGKVAYYRDGTYARMSGGSPMGTRQELLPSDFNMPVSAEETQAFKAKLSAPAKSLAKSIVEQIENPSADMRTTEAIVGSAIRKLEAMVEENFRAGKGQTIPQDLYAAANTALGEALDNTPTERGEDTLSKARDILRKVDFSEGRGTRIPYSAEVETLVTADAGPVTNEDRRDLGRARVVSNENLDLEISAAIKDADGVTGVFEYLGDAITNVFRWAASKEDAIVNSTAFKAMHPGGRLISGAHNVGVEMGVIDKDRPFEKNRTGSHQVLRDKVLTPFLTKLETLKKSDPEQLRSLMRSVTITAEDGLSEQALDPQNPLHWALFKQVATDAFWVKADETYNEIEERTTWSEAMGALSGAGGTSKDRTSAVNQVLTPYGY